MDSSQYYALVITSAQNEHKKDNDKEESRRLLSKIVTTEDHLAKVDILLQWQVIQLFRDMKLHMFLQVPEMESVHKEQAGNVLSRNTRAEFARGQHLGQTNCRK